MKPIPVLVQKKINDCVESFPSENCFLILLLDDKDIYLEESAKNIFHFHDCTKEWWNKTKEELNRSKIRLFEYHCDSDDRTNKSKSKTLEVTDGYKSGKAWGDNFFIRFSNQIDDKELHKFIDKAQKNITKKIKLKEKTGKVKPAKTNTRTAKSKTSKPKTSKRRKK